MTKTCLVVIDGWGIGEDYEGNAITRAKTPVMDHLASNYAYTTLSAHGLSVGLNDGLMGNSEVGHLNIGAGRVVYQDIVRIDLSLEDKSIYQNATLLSAINRTKANNGKLHFAGLVSDGGVHSHIRHLQELLRVAKENKINECYVHAFTDGRDTHPRSADKFIPDLVDFMSNEIQFGKLGTIMGRYYAMDRDNRTERIQIAADALLDGKGTLLHNTSQESIVAAIRECYEKGVTDEFFMPMIVDVNSVISNNDTIICFNYRSDRMRQICDYLLANYTTKLNLEIATMTQYKKGFPFTVLFPQQSLDNVLAEYVSKQGLTQYHCAETEKYAHVTFFFNGGVEAAYPNEDRSLIASPKVATYNLDPEMSCIAVANDVASRIKEGIHDLIILNFAPPDMVGHTGVLSATLVAIEATDRAIGIVYEACKQGNYSLLVTSDHGNAERMLDNNNHPVTSHTCNRVPLCTNFNKELIKLSTDSKDALCDIAPTILRNLNLPIPPEMTGHSLFIE